MKLIAMAVKGKEYLHSKTYASLPRIEAQRKFVIS